MELLRSLLFFVGRMNPGFERRTTAYIRDSSDVDKGYIPKWSEQCHKNRIQEPPNIMRMPPSLTATQPTVMAAEIMSKGSSTQHKPMSIPHEPIKAQAMLMIVQG
jgi:hypothetical protein